MQETVLARLAESSPAVVEELITIETKKETTRRVAVLQRAYGKHADLTARLEINLKFDVVGVDASGKETISAYSPARMEVIKTLKEELQDLDTAVAKAVVDKDPNWEPLEKLVGK